MKYSVEVIDDDNWVRQISETFNTNKTLKINVDCIPKYLYVMPTTSDGNEHEIWIIVDDETLMKGLSDNGQLHKVIVNTEFPCNIFMDAGKYCFDLTFVKIEKENHKVIYHNYRHEDSLVENE